MLLSISILTFQPGFNLWIKHQERVGMRLIKFLRFKELYQQLLLPLFSPRPATTVEEIARCPQNDILKVRCYELRKLKSVYSELLYKILFYRIQADPFVQKPCAAAKFAR